MKKSFFKLTIVSLILVFALNACKNDKDIDDVYNNDTNSEQKDENNASNEDSSNEEEDNNQETPVLPSICGQWISQDGTTIIDIKASHADSVIIATTDGTTIKRIWQYPIGNDIDSVATEGNFITLEAQDVYQDAYGTINTSYDPTIFSWSELTEESVVIDEVSYQRNSELIAIPAWLSIYKKWEASSTVDYGGLSIDATANFDFVTYPKDNYSALRQFYCSATGKAMSGFINITADPMGPWNMTITYSANTKLSGNIYITNCNYSYTIPVVNKTVSFNELSCDFSELEENSVYIETQMFNREFKATAFAK